MRRIEMLKAREILRLKHETNLSCRDIGNTCDCGKSTVSDVLKRANDAGITYPTTFNDKQLMSLLYPQIPGKNSDYEPDMDYVFYEMKKKNLTLMLLWEEYKINYPKGIMYTQFCERYKKFKKENNLTMHREHSAGEEVQVDWAGSTIPYFDQRLSEFKEAYIFVGVLPASSYPFVYAYDNQKQPSWIDAHVRMYEFFGGVPKTTIPDNCKTAVTTSDLFNPILNKSYYEMACHYSTTILPARARKPKDKGAGENMVGNVSRRILAALRNHKFFSLYDVNQALSDELQKFIKRPFQKLEGNRATSFERLDKLMLKPLPSIPYEFANWKEGRVQFNYHVDYDKFFYSVHYSYVGETCSIRATIKIIEIFIGTKRIAVHKRNYNKLSRYTTLVEHMPEKHKVVLGWNEERFLSWAAQIGASTKAYIKYVLVEREHPIQAYRACMSIMRLSKNVSSDIMEQACKEALEKRTFAYKYFNIILSRINTQNSKKIKISKIITHENVRGSRAYEGVGINVK